MSQEEDQANLMGQVAGIVAAMLAIEQALPPTTRKRLTQHLHAQFESLITAMSAGDTGASSGREGAEWVRDLLLRQIEKTTKKPKAPEATPAAAIVPDLEL